MRVVCLFNCSKERNKGIGWCDLSVPVSKFCLPQFGDIILSSGSASVPVACVPAFAPAVWSDRFWLGCFVLCVTEDTEKRLLVDSSTAQELTFHLESQVPLATLL